MNKIKFRLLFFVFFAFSCCKIKNVDDNKNACVIKKILVKEVDFDIDTAICIECQNFSSMFAESIKTRTVENSESLRRVYDILETFEYTKDSYVIDTRKMIVIIYIDNSKDSLCMDRFQVSINCNNIKVPNKDFDFLKKL